MNILLYSFEIIKVRMQNNPHKYSNVIVGLNSIIREEGILTLWRGLMPSMSRSILLTVSQIGPYKFAKHNINYYLFGNNNNMDDSVLLHLMSSLYAGLVSTTVTSPFDVIKTRIMASDNNMVSLYGSLTHMIKNEGIIALFRGWIANYVRLGPQTTFIFMSYEQFCKLFNVGGF